MPSTVTSSPTEAGEISGRACLLILACCNSVESQVKIHVALRLREDVFYCALTKLTQDLGDKATHSLHIR